jgi:hypothetical protein
VNASKRWYEVNLDGSTIKVEATDEADAIRVARAGRPTDIKAQSAVECDAPVEEASSEAHSGKSKKK